MWKWRPLVRGEPVDDGRHDLVGQAGGRQLRNVDDAVFNDEAAVGRDE